MSDVSRQPYGVSTAIQKTHAPKIKPSVAFFVHEGADAVAAVQARRSGAAPSLGDGPLKKRPLFGGMADVSNAPAAPANIVGLDEKKAAGSAKGGEVRVTKKNKST